MTPIIEKKLKAIQAGKVPAGYRKTAVGIVPKEWEVFRLKNIAVHSTEKNNDNKFHLTLTNSATKGVIKQIDYFDKQISNNENTDSYYIVNPGDFIYNPRISESAPCGPINRSHIDETGIASPLYTVFRLTGNTINEDFAELYLKSSVWHRYMSGVANYGARHDRMNITNDDLFAMPILSPPLSEQKKIAEILTAQDRVIALKEKLVAEKRKQKKFLMQRLLSTNDTRPFKLNGVLIEKGKWGVVRLKNIAVHSTEKNKDNKFHLTLTNSATKGVIKQIDYFDKQISNNENTGSYYIVNPGDFIYNPRISESAPCGPINRSHIDETGIASPLYTVFRLTGNTINEDFAELYLKSSVWHRYMSGVANYGARHDRMNITNDDLFAMPILSPPLPEQQAIAEVLSAADREISLLQQGLEQERQKKKSLMQLLLSGLVQVNVPEDPHEL